MMADRAVTERQVQAAILVAKAVAEAIQGLGQVPTGHLYAHLMGHMSLDSFEGVIGSLVQSGLVKRDGSHMLTWTGPAKEGA